MEAILLDVAQYFVKNAPVVIVLGYIIHVLWKDSKEQRALIRENELENLIVLKKLSFILEKTVDENRTNFKQVKDDVSNLHKYVGSKIDRLEDKLSK